MGRVFACSDLHGSGQVYDAMRKFIQPGDKVYFLGDAADRGPDGWRIIKSIATDPQWVYLRGNHEQLFSDAVYEFIKHGHHGRACNLLFYNGGNKTFSDWQANGSEVGWAYYLSHRPIEETYTNKDGILIHLVHDGFTPEWDRGEVLWNRDHFLEDWPSGHDNEIVVHGHTPIPYVRKNLGDWDVDIDDFDPGAFWYCNDHKCCIDNLTAYTNTGALLDLDTFDEHIFN